MANTAGRATATTLLIPLRRGWSLWCRVLFWAAKRFSWITAPLRTQSFIHMAHWSLVDRLAGQPLGRTALYFESNFDSSMDEYVDVFVEAVPWRMRTVWAGGVGYPGLYPSDEYQEWSKAHAHSVQHYFSGYPEATTAEVAAAVRVDDALRPFVERAHDMDDEQFDEAYRQLLTDVGRWL
jgi:trans-aconitate methyltransferase